MFVLTKGFDPFVSYLWTVRVRKAVGTYLNATPSRVGWFVRSCTGPERLTFLSDMCAVTSTEEVMFSPMSVKWFVGQMTQKLPNDFQLNLDGGRASA